MLFGTFFLCYSESPFGRMKLLYNIDKQQLKVYMRHIRSIIFSNIKHMRAREKYLFQSQIVFYLNARSKQMWWVGDVMLRRPHLRSPRCMISAHSLFVAAHLMTTFVVLLGTYM